MRLVVAQKGVCFFHLSECARAYCDAGFLDCFTAAGCSNGSLTGAAIDVQCDYAKGCQLP